MFFKKEKNPRNSLFLDNFVYLNSEFNRLEKCWFESSKFHPTLLISNMEFRIQTSFLAKVICLRSFYVLTTSWLKSLKQKAQNVDIISSVYLRLKSIYGQIIDYISWWVAAHLGDTLETSFLRFCSSIFAAW